MKQRDGTYRQRHRRGHRTHPAQLSRPTDVLYDLPNMAKRTKRPSDPSVPAPAPATVPPANPTAAPRAGRPSSLLDTRVIYCGDNLEQLAKLPDACVDLIGTRSRAFGIDPPFNSNRTTGNLGSVFWGETKEKRIFEDRHASTQAYPGAPGRPRCVQLARVLKKTGSFYYHCDWHALQYVEYADYNAPVTAGSYAPRRSVARGVALL